MFVNWSTNGHKYHNVRVIDSDGGYTAPPSSSSRIGDEEQTAWSTADDLGLISVIWLLVLFCTVYVGVH